MHPRVKICGIVRGVAAAKYREGLTTGQAHVSNRGDLAVVQALPQRTELVRLGSSYITRSTLIGPNNGDPTTFVTFNIYNGETEGGKHYLIDTIGWVVLQQGGAPTNDTMRLWAQLSVSPVARPNGTLSTTIQSLSGRQFYGGKALASSGSIAPIEAWHEIACMVPTAGMGTTILGMASEVNVYGRYIVPPGGMFALTITWPLNANSRITPWIIFHEVNLTLN